MPSTLPRSFEDLVNQSEVPVLVDFWAEWCGPCHQIAPAIKRIAGEYKGRLLVVKINIDEKPHVADRYAVRSIPTIMILHRGKTLMREAGALPYEMLRQRIEAALPR